MINKVFLIGNLGKDPELKRFDNGGVIAIFSLATAENYMDKNGEWQTITDWHNIVLRGKTAERAEKYLHKGNTIFIEGKIRTRKWQDANGNNRYTTEIIGSSYRSIGNRRDNDEASLPKDSSKQDNTSENNDENPVDDLPF